MFARARKFGLAYLEPLSSGAPSARLQGIISHGQIGVILGGCDFVDLSVLHERRSGLPTYASKPKICCMIHGMQQRKNTLILLVVLIVTTDCRMLARQPYKESAAVEA